MSEDATFKSVMTSTGCMIFLAALLLLPLALAGPPLGLTGRSSSPTSFPRSLVFFIILQSLRVVVRRPSTQEEGPRDGDPQSASDPP